MGRKLHLTILLVFTAVLTPVVAFSQGSSPQVELQECLKERPNVCKFRISGPGSQILMKKKVQHPIKVTFQGKTLFIAQQYKFLASSDHETLMLAKGSWLVGSEMQRTLRARKIKDYRLLVSRKKIIKIPLQSPASYSQSVL